MAAVIDINTLKQALGVQPQPQPAAASTLDTILQLLSNPVVQAILQRIVDRFMPPANQPMQMQPQNPANPANPMPQITGEMLLNGIIMFLQAFPPQTTVAEIVQELTAHKAEYASKLDSVVKMFLGR